MIVSIFNHDPVGDIVHSTTSHKSNSTQIYLLKIIINMISNNNSPLKKNKCNPMIIWNS